MIASFISGLLFGQNAAKKVFRKCGRLPVTTFRINLLPASIAIANVFIQQALTTICPNCKCGEHHCLVFEQPETACFLGSSRVPFSQVSSFVFFEFGGIGLSICGKKREKPWVYRPRLKGSISSDFFAV